MKLKWQIPAITLLLLVAGCSKDSEKMSGELVIEDFKVLMKLLVSDTNDSLF